MTDSPIKPPDSHREVIDLWPSVAEFARDMGVGYEAAKQMRRRNSIGGDHWVVVVEKAGERGFIGVTLEMLSRTASARRRPSSNIHLMLGGAP